MITLRDIKAAITTLLKSKYPNYEVHFDNVEKSKAPYFYVELIPIATSIDDVYSDRTVQVDITYIHPKDKHGRVSRVIVFDMADRLDQIIRPVFKMKDRAITIKNAETTIVDDVLHYIFNLDFVDVVIDTESGQEKYETAKNLYLNLNNTDKTEEE